MRISRCLLTRPIAAGLALFLAMPLAQASAVPPQQDLAGSQPQSVSSPQNQPPAAANQDQAGQAGSGQAAASDQQPNSAGKPVGTAVAPLEKTTGVTASRPAGAVIAPAKQRRARSILIRVGVVVGAAVAVGAVVALSKASPSRPN